MDRTVLRIADLKHTEKMVRFFQRFLKSRIDIQLSILFFPYELFIMIYVRTQRTGSKKERQIEFVSVEWECAQIQTKRRQVQKIVTSSSYQDDNHTSYLTLQMAGGKG